MGTAFNVKTTTTTTDAFRFFLYILKQQQQVLSCSSMRSSLIAAYRSTGMVANPARGQLNAGKLFVFYSPRPRLRIWSRESGSAVPSDVNPLILQTRAESAACSRDSSRFPRRHPDIPSTAIGSVPSLYQVTQLRTDGVHCQESAGTRPVVLEVVSIAVQICRTCLDSRRVWMQC